MCDRDPTFTSNFWRELFRLQGTKFNFSSAYHPQTDGQTKVVNHTLEMYLRCVTGDKPKDWVKWLPWVEYIYNTSWHSSTGRTPFEIVYGCPSPTLLSYIPGTACVDSVEQELLERDTLLKQVRLKLSQAQNRMKQVYDKNHKQRVFLSGDLVYVRLHPYCQHSVEKHLNMKLAAKYYGPYRVVNRVGEVAYKLELPPGSKIHPIFHVSLLKQQIGPRFSPSTTLPEAPYSERVLHSQAILESQGKDRTKELLVHWQGYSPADATWERITTLQQQFPNFVLEDKDKFKGGGVL